MSELPDRVERAFRDHGSFDRVDEATYAATTVFDGVVTATDAGEGRVGFEVTVRVPTLEAAVVGHVADVVEEGWYETFALRAEDVGGVLEGDHAPSPTVAREVEEVVTRYDFEEINPRRGVDDAAALVNYVEGTYVQGIIPGYEYTGPAAELVSSARMAAED